LSLPNAACAQKVEPVTPVQDSKPIDDELQKKLVAAMAEQGITLDVKAQTLTVDAEVLVTNDFLEYLLIGKRGKSHEALFRTQVKASSIKAGMIGLGYEDGTNADTREKNPLPTEEEIKNGAEWFEVIPPKGTRLWIYVEWQGKDKKPVRHKAEDLWIDVNSEDQTPPKSVKWVFFGGRMAPLYRGEPPVFVADFEENLISMCYMKPDNHLITGDHEQAREDKIWWPNMKILPETGTPVRLILSKKPLE
jgi:hypothetical protein